MSWKKIVFAKLEALTALSSTANWHVSSQHKLYADIKTQLSVLVKKIDELAAGNKLAECNARIDAVEKRLRELAGVNDELALRVRKLSKEKPKKKEK